VNDDAILVMDSDNDANLVMDGDNDAVLTEDTPYYEKESDYEKLKNKPKINNVELVGNRFLADLFQDGIIIDGGEAVV
jgi:hypothetical protein